MYANVLWVKKGGSLGRHRHRGRVFGYTLEGSWRYLEYDWIARPGSYVQESPGAIHTLVSDEGMKTMFWLNGSLEFFDDNDNLLETLDVFWMMDHYLSYCRENGIKVNQKVFV
jgi:quercetin dioxygenase-like cupin family protein